MKKCRLPAFSYWQEELDHYREEGKDLRELNLRNLDDMRESLMRYLPETFHPYIHDGTLVTEYPTPRLRVLVNQWELGLRAENGRTE